jgi:hypothetical protein
MWQTTNKKPADQFARLYFASSLWINPPFREGLNKISAPVKDSAVNKRPII